MRRPRSLLLTAGCLTALALGISACGPNNSPANSSSTATGSTPTTATSSGHPAANGVTPEQVCGAMSLAQASHIAGITLSSAVSDMSGDTAVCSYKAMVDGTELGKMITEFQPTGKGAVEYTRHNGETVDHLGQAAVWFASSGQLSVEVGGEAVVHVFVEDNRLHGNDPRGAAIAVAELIVPALTPTH